MKNLNKYFIYANIIFFYFTSCEVKKNNVLDKNLIEKIVKESEKTPSQFSSIYFYGKCDSNKIAKLSLQDLKAVHKIKYPSMSLKEFLTESLNQHIFVNYKNKIVCFELNNDILISYKKNNFDNFLNTYTDNFNNRLTLKSTINNTELNTISYYFFLHNYIVLYDDYIGVYYVEEISSWSKDE